MGCTTDGGTQAYQWYNTGLIKQVSLWTGTYGSGSWGHKQNDYTYDAAGQRIATTTLAYTPPSVTGYWDYYAGFVVTGWSPGYYQEVRENYDYDGAGRITAIRITQGAGQLDFDPVTGLPVTAAPPAAAASGGVTRSAFTYDLMGRQLTQSDYNEAGTSVVYGRSSIFDVAGKLVYDSTTTVKSDGTYTTSSGYGYTSSSGEYLLGAVGSVSSNNSKNGSYQNSSSTTNAFQWWNGAVQSTITYSQGGNTYTTDLVYDGLGTLRFAHIKDGRPRRAYYGASADGQIFHRDEEDYNNNTGDPHEMWYRFGGREWGYIGNNGTSKLSEAASIADRTAVGGSGNFRNGSGYATSASEFSHGYDPINSYNQGSAAGAYTVQRTGESLRGIAQGLWGDASLWYKLAEANGLSAEASLIEGQRLTVPAGVVRGTYNAGTVKPYNPAEAIGNVQPTTPKPVPPKKKSCLGAIFLAIIAIAVAVVATGGILAAATGKSLAAGLATIGIGSGTAIAGVSTAGLIAAGTAGAAVGSIVSQGIGVATGIQDKFSWKAVGLSALTAFLGPVPVGKIAGSAFLGNVVGGALTNAAVQGIAVATGLQDKFSWAGVAAAGIGAGVGGAVGSAFKAPTNALGVLGQDLAVSTASTLANAATRSAIEGSSFGENIAAALPDAIGGAVGRALGRAGADSLRRAQETMAQRLERQGFKLVGQFADSGAIRTDGPTPAERALQEEGSTEIVVTATREQIKAAKRGILWHVGHALGIVDDDPVPQTASQRELGSRFFATYSAAYARQDKVALAASYARDAQRADAIQAQVNRETWNLVNAGIQPLQSLTGGYRWIVNGEHTLENGLAVGSALLGPTLKYGAPVVRAAVPEGVAFLRNLRSTAPAAERSLAARNVWDARGILREAGLNPAQRGEVIRSFDLTTLRVERTTSQTTAYRLFDDIGARLEGRYVSGDFFANQTDRIQRFALPGNSATRLGEVTIPRAA